MPPQVKFVAAAVAILPADVRYIVPVLVNCPDGKLFGVNKVFWILNAPLLLNDAPDTSALLEVIVVVPAFTNPVPVRVTVAPILAVAPLLTVNAGDVPVPVKVIAALVVKVDPVYTLIAVVKPVTAFAMVNDPALTVPLEFCPKYKLFAAVTALLGYTPLPVKYNEPVLVLVKVVTGFIDPEIFKSPELVRVVILTVPPLIVMIPALLRLPVPVILPLLLKIPLFVMVTPVTVKAGLFVEVMLVVLATSDAF